MMHKQIKYKINKQIKDDASINKTKTNEQINMPATKINKINQ
jgi:hypothetical protein